MDNFIIELSRYILIILMALYTYYAFRVILNKSKKRKIKIYRHMDVIMYVFQALGYLTLYLTSKEQKLIIFYAIQLVIFLMLGALYNVCYPNRSRLIYRNMMMLFMIGVLVITRLDFAKGIRQFAIGAIILFVSLIIPFLIERFRLWSNLAYTYIIIGLATLVAVLLFGTTEYGAKIWIVIAGIKFQPSEFVKLLFIFGMGALLSAKNDFKHIVKVTVIAALHVIVLVLEKDLGGALLFYVTYLVMLYCATRKPLYLFAGLASGAVAAVGAYFLFSHVQVRVEAFVDPFAVIDGAGYQIAQSLFAIGTGGWFGLGLGKGLPTSIPVVVSDFIFSAISEEFGGLFAICIILICISCFVMFINISTKLKNPLYKLVALGFSTMYIFQVFLNIGGVIKFIPSTGVTLPLISYGGSSIMSIIIMFSIVQGLYVLHMKKNGTADVIETEETEQKRERYNRSSVVFTYVFSFLLFGVIGYYSYFIITKGTTVINNSYNPRQDLLATQVTRGKILSADGNILAQTVTMDDGTEVRVYPYGSMFSHTVGRFLKGRSGIELSENFTLLTSNINGFEKLTNEFAGEKNPGDNVVTTLNTKLQQAAYDALGDYKGAVVVLEPSTGKILAMVSKPDYNPNTVSVDWENLVNSSNSVLLNRATQGLYPPGSTFKILTALEFMRENPDYDNYTYTCEGEGVFNHIAIHCAGNSVHGTESLLQSFKNSCNTSFANLGTSLNMDSFRAFCNSFLFNTTLPTSFKTSASSFVLDGTTDLTDLPQTVIGLGKTTITPLHNALIAATIANGGVMMTPYFVDRVETADGDVVSKNRPQAYGSIISTNEAATITEFMKEVVNSGTGTKLNNMSVDVAGKTGSADYEIGKDSHAWFVGFAPADNPEIAISVIVESVGTGSAYAVPITKKVLEAYFNQ